MKIVVTTTYADGTVHEEEIEQDETPNSDSPTD